MIHLSYGAALFVVTNSFVTNRTRAPGERMNSLLRRSTCNRNSKSADGRTRTRIDLFRRQAPDPFGHVRKLRSQGSNLDSLGSKPSVLPITPLRNVGGWGRIRTGCLWSFNPALFLMSFPTVIRGSRIEDRRSRSSIFYPRSSICSRLTVLGGCQFHTGSSPEISGK